jgi:hypothetical protein
MQRQVIPEEAKMANKYMKRCPTLLEIREMQIGRMKCHLYAGKKEFFLHYWWECKLVQPLWKKIRRLLKNLNIGLLYDQQYHSWGYTQKTVTEVTPEALAHPYLLQHYSQ